MTENVSDKIFVGQMKKKGIGMSQKEQLSVLDDFRNSLFNTIVMTSVGGDAGLTSLMTLTNDIKKQNVKSECPIIFAI